MDFTKRMSTNDLYSLAKKLNIHNFIVCRKSELPKILNNQFIKNIIINLDDIGNGSHWVACNTTKKMYFDSYAQQPPTTIPNNYRLASTKKELQSIDSTICGSLCCLWLYYINHKSNDQYYDKFKDVYL